MTAMRRPRTSSALGETVRARVKQTCGVTLQWEIIRLGLPADGRPTGEALAEAFAQ